MFHFKLVSPAFFSSISINNTIASIFESPKCFFLISAKIFLLYFSPLIGSGIIFSCDFSKTNTFEELGHLSF